MHSSGLGILPVTENTLMLAEVAVHWMVDIFHDGQKSTESSCLEFRAHFPPQNQSSSLGWPAVWHSAT